MAPQTWILTGSADAPLMVDRMRAATRIAA
jgi:hypothetical protein